MVCNYGSMSGEDPVMPRSKLIGEGQSLVGFILGRALAPRSIGEVRAIYAELGEQVRAGVLTAPVERVYPIEEIRAAVAHAERGERAGKILVAPNGRRSSRRGGGHQEERRPLPLVGPLRVRRDLLRARPPLVEVRRP